MDVTEFSMGYAAMFLATAALRRKIEIPSNHFRFRTCVCSRCGVHFNETVKIDDITVDVVKKLTQES